MPLLSGTAAGSLGPQDLEEIEVGAVAVDIIELALSLGLERVERLGGLPALTGWRGPLVAVARMTAEIPAATGRRARALPRLVSERDGVLELRSSIDGATVRLTRPDLAAAARRLGAEPARWLAEDGVEVVVWDQGDPVPGALLVSTLDRDMAAMARFWDGTGWASLPDSTGRGNDALPLLEGCRCRACGIARRGYLAYLWAMREITAEHLLGWHNLHQLRLLVEGEGSAG